MSIAEKLTTIAENVPKVFEAGYEKGKSEGGTSAYETIVFTQDCNNAEEVWNVLNATTSKDDKIVYFINKAWFDNPSMNPVQNQALSFVWHAEEFYRGQRLCQWMRWRDNAFNIQHYIVYSFDCIVSAGAEWIKVVVL
jgi:hypothetical protein